MIRSLPCILLPPLSPLRPPATHPPLHHIQMRRKVMESEKSIKEVFADLDVNGDGVVSLEEFRDGVKAMGINVTAIQARMLMKAFDTDENGTIDYDEFYERFVLSK
uniref:EF-hand domain-containing protein n=1 Tax=Palpitomonas bilix TaxID=652834 RepID=A0A7S3GAV9_9EUKA|mmetsp:Transcript_4237/g.8409  ORF Transcript_4237/g.8409 Transcript_4237/m.8409 type:complete len:106 (+) Transcript_4237:141-458(+)